MEEPEEIPPFRIQSDNDRVIMVGESSHKITEGRSNGRIVSLEIDVERC